MLLVLAGVSLKCQLMGGMITVNSSRCLPTFLILGAQKCGTTSLARALARNPHIFLPSAKEAHYFGEVADEDIDAATYSQFFSGWSHEPMIGEATPEYLALPGAASQIHRLLPVRGHRPEPGRSGLFALLAPTSGSGIDLGLWAGVG